MPAFHKQMKETDLDNLTQPQGIVTVFSPLKNDSMLAWYASKLAGAEQTAMFTAAFGVEKRLAAQFAVDRPFVRFVLLEDNPDAALAEAFQKDPDVWYAYGSLLGAFSSGRPNFQNRASMTGFLRRNSSANREASFFVHTKFLLDDPLSDNPLICTGSANFSKSSLVGNDENMLLMRGATSVANVYLTEFDRIFRHFYARQEINRRILGGEDISASKFLNESGDWVEEYVTSGRKKTNRQQIFFSNWPN